MNSIKTLFLSAYIDVLAQIGNQVGLIRALNHPEVTIRTKADEALCIIMYTGRTDVIYRLVDMGWRDIKLRPSILDIIRKAPALNTGDILVSLLDAAIRDPKATGAQNWLCDMLIAMNAKAVLPVIRVYGHTQLRPSVERVIFAIGLTAYDVISLAVQHEDITIRAQAKEILFKFSKRDFDGSYY